MSKLRLSFLVFVIFTLSSLSSPPKQASAQFVYFQDDFNDGSSDGWIVPRNTCSSIWRVNEGKYGITINSPCVTETIPSSLSIPADSSYVFEVDMVMAQSANMDRNFVFKYLNPSNWYGIHTIGNSIYVQKVVNGTEYFLNNRLAGYSFSDSQTYRFAVEVTPIQIRVYVNGVLTHDIVDSPPQFANSSAGLQASSGTISSSEVWFDNVVVKELVSSIPTPTPNPNPSPSPMPIPITTNSKKFELPFNYPGRLLPLPVSFKNAFWDRLTAAFDHSFATGIFRPFTGNTYLPSDCQVGTHGISCYDSHNGTDFSQGNDLGVYSVSNGSVAYASTHTDSDCTPEPGGFGCVVIAKYQGNNYGLYAHLSKINVNDQDSLTSSTIIGQMGNTGCQGCGTHLHFGIMKPVSTRSSVNQMSRRDWSQLLSTIKPSAAPKYPAFCTYRAPNGNSFAFEDPSGWNGPDKDPWGLPKSKGGCGARSDYLWKYEI